MDEDDGVSGEEDGWAKDIARVGDAFVEGTEGNFFEADELEFGIEEDNLEGFFGEGAHGGAEEGVDEFWAIDFLFGEGFFGESGSEAEGGGELDGFGGADAFDAGQFIDGAAGEATERLKFLEELAGEFDGIDADEASAEEDGDEFAIGEGSGAEVGEFFAGTIVGGEFLDSGGGHGGWGMRVRLEVFFFDGRTTFGFCFGGGFGRWEEGLVGVFEGELEFGGIGGGVACGIGGLAGDVAEIFFGEGGGKLPIDEAPVSEGGVGVVGGRSVFEISWGGEFAFAGGGAVFGDEMRLDFGEGGEGAAIDFEVNDGGGEFLVNEFERPFLDFLAGEIATGEFEDIKSGGEGFWGGEAGAFDESADDIGGGGAERDAG
jgi:hypothetical protein